jgi:4-amino-4-deoxy-L-arabinose transferase-like glycosyltransferase
VRKNNNYLNIVAFALVAGGLCLLYCLLFRPITFEAQGDSPAYINLARQIYNLPGAETMDLSHRSPLYSIILGLFILVFGETHYLAPLMVFQYALVFLSSIFIYKIFRQLTGSQTIAFISGLGGILNLTTIFFGYMILSETLALFLFTVTMWFLLKYYDDGRVIYSAAAGVTAGLLILTRYNLLGLPLVIAVILPAAMLLKKKDYKVLNVLAGLAIFAGSTALVVNTWALRNYVAKGRYELLPKHHMGQRWAVPSTISPDDIVSEEYKPVLDIFLKTREGLIEKSQGKPYRKSSLLNYSFIREVNDYFRPPVSGYLLYRDSEDELLRHFQLEKTPEGIRLLNGKLKPFYSEIAARNKGELRRLRVYSFLYSFKHISPTLPGSEPVNLNRLPSFFLQAYKVLFIVMMVITYAGSIAHSVYILRRKERIRPGLKWILIYGVIWYFPAVNFYASVLGDANRFRYPADMVIIGLFTVFCAYFLRGIFKSRNVHEGSQTA